MSILRKLESDENRNILDNMGVQNFYTHQNEVFAESTVEVAIAYAARALIIHQQAPEAIANAQPGYEHEAIISYSSQEKAAQSAKFLTAVAANHHQLVVDRGLNPDQHAFHYSMRLLLMGLTLEQVQTELADISY